MTTRDTLALAVVIAAVSFTNFAGAEEISYSTLNSKYSTTAPEGFKEAVTRDYGEDSPNSCAIRLAFALEALDREFVKDFQSKTVYKNKPIRARELADYLAKRIPGGMSIPTGEAGRKAVDERKGIVYFANIRPRPGQTGVSWHISLWDGHSVADDGDYFDRAKSIQFWPLD